MNYWKIVEAGDYKKYAKGVYDLFLTEKRLFWNINPFWNAVSQESIREVIERVPELFQLEDLYGTINEITVLVLNREIISTLHVDHTIGPNTGIKARLNIPVLNCEYSETAFYEMSEEVFSNHTTEWEGTKWWPNHLRDVLKPTTKISLVQPTVLRTSAPHTVFCYEDKYPRVSLTISFKKDLIYLLE